MRIVLSFLAVLSLLPHPAKAVNETIRDLGDIGQIAIPAAALGITMVKHDRIGVDQLMLSGFFTIGTTYAIKGVLNTPRPCGGSGSFPSGHTAGAFTGAAYLHRRYGWKYGLPAYMAASFVGYSRVYVGMHRPIDVIGSALLAIGFNQIFTRPYNCGYNIVPVVSRDCVGVSASKEF